MKNNFFKKIIIIILLIFIFFIIMKKNIEHFELKKPKIIIFETNQHEKNVILLKQTLEKYNMNYIFLGNDIKWKGFGTKILEIQKYLKTQDENDVVVIIDARDVLTNNYPEKLIEYFNKNDKNQIIFGCEKGCCTPGVTDNVKNFMHDKGKLYNQDNDFLYLNAGLYMGRIKNILDLYEKINIKEEDDDQTLISNYWSKNPEKIKLDYDQEIFSNSNFWKNECFFSKDENKNNYKNTFKNTYPVFIHTPAKHFTCYDSISN